MDLVKVTRDITPESAESGYRQGIFPMADFENGIVTWHRPRRRAVIPLDEFHVSHSLERRMRKSDYQVTFDRAFSEVMRACADRDPTWISDDFVAVYTELHRRGKAHSVEVRIGGRLVGGTYGVHLGGAFFAESKFHRVTDMSKVALASLAGWLRAREFLLLEVQYVTPHLAQFGAIEITDAEYRRRLDDALQVKREF